MYHTAPQGPTVRRTNRALTRLHRRYPGFPAPAVEGAIFVRENPATSKVAIVGIPRTEHDRKTFDIVGRRFISNAQIRCRHRRTFDNRSNTANLDEPDMVGCQHSQQLSRLGELP